MTQKENQHTEFKSGFNDEVIETLTAFANTQGGSVLVGVKNDGEPVKGFRTGDESLQQWLNEIKTKTQPSIIPDAEVIEYKGGEVVEFRVPEFPVKPVACRGRYFKRVKNSNHQLAVDEIAEMRFVSLNYSFDSFKVDTPFDELDIKALELFSKGLAESGRYASSGNLYSDLDKIGLVTNRKVTRAAQLLFGTHYTAIHIGRFKSKDTIIDDTVIRSPLIVAVEEAMAFIKRNIMLSYNFTGELKRQERWQYPLQAIRELLLNAVVHKDYTNPTDVIIKIFDESIEFSNPGHLFSGLTAEDLQTDNYLPRHRNKLLAEAFYLTGDIEKYGTGFIRLRRWLKEYPELKYEFKDDSHFVRVNLLANTSNGEKDVTKEILVMMKEKPAVTTLELAERLRVSRRTIVRQIDKLKERDIISRTGGRKNGEWKINDPHWQPR